jgi:hypothetical protein
MTSWIGSVREVQTLLDGIALTRNSVARSPTARITTFEEVGESPSPARESPSVTTARVSETAVQHPSVPAPLTEDPFPPALPLRPFSPSPLPDIEELASHWRGFGFGDPRLRAVVTSIDAAYTRAGTVIRRSYYEPWSCTVETLEAELIIANNQIATELSTNRTLKRLPRAYGKIPIKHFTTAANYLNLCHEHHYYAVSYEEHEELFKHLLEFEAVDAKLQALSSTSSWAFNFEQFHESLLERFRRRASSDVSLPEGLRRRILSDTASVNPEQLLPSIEEEPTSGPRGTQQQYVDAPSAGLTTNQRQHADTQNSGPPGTEEYHGGTQYDGQEGPGQYYEGTQDSGGTEYGDQEGPDQYYEGTQDGEGTEYSDQGGTDPYYEGTEYCEGTEHGDQGGTDPYHGGTPYGDRRPSSQTASSQTGWVRHRPLQDVRREIADNYDIEMDGIVVGWNGMGTGIRVCVEYKIGEIAIGRVEPGRFCRYEKSPQTNIISNSRALLQKRDQNTRKQGDPQWTYQDVDSVGLVYYQVDDEFTHDPVSVLTPLPGAHDTVYPLAYLEITWIDNTTTLEPRWKLSRLFKMSAYKIALMLYDIAFKQEKAYKAAKANQRLGTRSLRRNFCSGTRLMCHSQAAAPVLPEAYDGIGDQADGDFRRESPVTRRRRPPRAGPVPARLWTSYNAPLPVTLTEARRKLSDQRYYPTPPYTDSGYGSRATSSATSAVNSSLAHGTNYIRPVLTI